MIEEILKELNLYHHLTQEEPHNPLYEFRQYQIMERFKNYESQTQL